jgi:N-acetylmuramoyl-L-alanine amidase
MSFARATAFALALAALAPSAALASDRLVARDEPVASSFSAHTSTTRRAPLEFDLVGLHWKGPGAVSFRTQAPGAVWSAWQAAAPETEDLPDRGSAEGAGRRGWKLGSPYWTGPATRIQYRFDGRVRRLRAFFVWSDPGSGSTASGLHLLASPSRPGIIRRADWGADESIVRAPPAYAPAVQFAVVHHTAGTNSYSESESAAIVRGIERYHILANGWNDIGYNFLVDKCGTIFEGRYGGMTKPVIGAQTKGFNTASAGIAIIGTYSSARPRPAAVVALERLIAWRLDVAYVDPSSRVEMVSSGNPRYRAGRRVVFNAVSGHRDGYPTSCPGSALYALLPRIRAAARAAGLPKIWSPSHTPNLHRIAPDAALPLELRAKFSKRTAFTLTIRAPDGAVVARRRHTNHHVRWTWGGRAPVLPGGAYSWSISAPGARGFAGPLGVLPLWGLRAPPDGFSVTRGTVTAGGLASLAHPEGSTLDIAPARGDPRTELVTEFGFPTTRPVATAGTLAGASAATTAGGPVDVALWDYGSSSWVDIGSCTAVPGRACKVQGPAAGHTFATWDAPSSSARMRVRLTFPGAAAVDSAHALLNG